MSQFVSDNVSPACPEVVEGLLESNVGAAASYGDDVWSQRLEARLSEVFETEVAVFPVATGTAANALALSALTPAYGKIYCHELAHINTDECAAPEFFTGGAKLIPISSADGKLSADALAARVYGRGNVHHAQPAVLSFAQSCETGVVYQLDEIAELAQAARNVGLAVHMDGARFANALCALDVSPADMTWRQGIDVLSFGGTKNGCFAAEAVVFFDPARAREFAYLHKRSGQLLSKMRFVAAQLEAYVNDEVWLRNARHANAMAARLSQGLCEMEQLELAYPTQSNEVFVRIPAGIVMHVRQQGYEVNDEELDGSAVRFVAAWNTQPEEIDRLLAAFRSF